MATTEKQRAYDRQMEGDGNQALTRHVLGLIAMSDRYEDSRRKTDRIGGNIFFSNHWNVAVATSRSALTVNIAKALIEHKISIMTKQRPSPVIEPTDVGDADSAELLKSCVVQWWDADGMQGKLEKALFLANTTRTSACKVCWDPTRHNRAGDITVDVLPGWRLILDPRTDDPKKMQFIGDRATMSRARAMLLYPKAAKVIRDAPAVKEQGPQANASGRGSPLRDAWQKLHLDFPSTAIVNGQPTLLSYTGNTPAKGETNNQVEIIELYIKDYTLVPKEVPVKDHMGRTKQKVVTDDETGIPQFNEVEGSHHELPDGTSVHIPNYELQMEDVTEMKDVLKYPFYRRITMILPDCEVIEDVAWDYPNPYALFADGQPLEGPWVKGSILDLETLQGSVNVSFSTMMDNLRFSAYRAYIAYNGSLIDKNNMNIGPGEILRAGEKGTLEPLPVEQVSQAWFGWINLVISIMEKIIGATGIMQGESAGRVDSAAGYDVLAEIGGSRLVKATHRMERGIGQLIEVVACFMQKHYTEQHAVRVEDATGNISFERITPGSLLGSFSYRVETGSSLAWSETAIRARVMEEFNAGLRDRISTWKALHVPEWRQIMSRMATEPAALQPPPPKRTRQTIPAHQKQPPKNK